MLKNTTRRELLKGAGALAATIAAPSVLHAATKETKGIDASRVGLVIGNSKYTDSPLSNPVNDANAIAQLSEVMGFKTQCLLNASLKDISAAVETYVDELQRQKAVGFFYYAGHGVQLGWRNYIVPIGANIDRLDDVPKQAYELNIMLAALTKAKNPMNIIILDACRDNPFGKRVLPEQKGLSQFDAPIGSLLSYATSPGNTASDGSGANGLFTENLLREMKVPLTKIEDVFKRVRLNVRLQSKGGQIPWESTSLEDDFYFIADEAQFKQAERALAQANANKAAEAVPQETGTLLARAEAEFSLAKQSVEQRIQTELSAWEQTLANPSVAALEGYLKRYPSGAYSEIAAARLDALLAKAGEKKLAVQSTDNNPYTKGTASGVTRYTVGDQFTYTENDGYTNIVEGTYTEVVTSVSDTQTVFDDGARIVDMLGNEEKSKSNNFVSIAQFYPNSYELGKTWRTNFRYWLPAGWTKIGFQQARKPKVAVDLKVVARESITTKAGTFNAFKIVGYGFLGNNGTTVEVRYWIDPERCSYPLLYEWNDGGGSVPGGKNLKRKELVAFRQRATG